MNKLIMATTAVNLLFASATNAGAGWKLDADGKIELKDGNPIYLDSSGKEMTVGVDTIGRLNGEAKTNRERAEAAETKLKLYGDLDPKIAKEAIEKLGKIDAKTLIDAGEVDKVRAEILAQVNGQIKEKDDLLASVQAKLDAKMIDEVFTGSQFVREQVAMPFDFFKDTMSKHFKIGKDGNVEAYDKAGNRISSKERIGEHATPEEALQWLVGQHPQKDTILKAQQQAGSGNQGGGGSQGKGRVIKRSDFDALTPAEQASTALSAGKGEVSIVD